MNPNAIMAIVNSILPELISFIKGFHNQNGTFPTDQQVIDQMNLDAAKVIAISDKWLQEHPNG
jgi:hypothetical protein